MSDHYDVVVIGGGAAGCPAAVQAARLGARTLLVEKNGALGGTTTVAGVFTVGLFHAWGRQVIAGIGWEAVSRSMELAGTSMPDFTDWEQPHWKLAVRVTPVIHAAVLDQLVLGSGAELRLHTMVGGVVRRDTEAGGGWEVTLCGKEGLATVTAGAIVDASGDANVVGQLGLERHTVDDLQPGTLIVRLGGYDMAELDRSALDVAYRVAVERGELSPADFSSAEKNVWQFLANRGQNAMHVPGIRAGTSVERTAAEVAARDTLMRIFSFLKAQPGLEDLVIEGWSVECGIRETWTVEGEVTVTVDDYTSGRVWPDAICHSYFPIDLHTSDAADTQFAPLTYGIVPSLPLRALIPAGEDRLLVAGRTLSADRLANSAARVQASSMAMGQAAGAAAALAVSRGVSVRNLDVGELQRTLREHGAIVPGRSS